MIDLTLGAECVAEGDNGSSYRGDVAVTETGVVCEKWDTKKKSGTLYPEK